MKHQVERWLATVFGLIFVGLSLLVTVETLSRKLFNVSLQGADELGGYSLAIGSTIAFSLALMGRSHIRVDVFHDRLPRGMQAVLNWLSMVFLWLFATLIAWLAFNVIQDTQSYKSVSQTPWATPLVYPQTLWLIGLVIFALVCLGYTLRATLLLFTGRIDDINHEFQPRSAKEELKEELEDLAVRSGKPVPTINAAAAVGGPV
jgi:TRAP-type C4-dicarboxylate transport system permease small subunit